jgi:predicted ester cyclase
MTMSDHAGVEDSDIAERAKRALERVCSGAGLDAASRYYSPSFVDHVNGLVLHGLEGIHASVALYKKALPDLKIEVQEQWVTADRVTSRFIVSGTSYRRRVTFSGITISRFEDGLIVEDWSVTDTFGMLQELGLWRSLLIELRNRKALKTANMPRRAHSGHRAASSPACSRPDRLQNASVLRKT